MIKFKERQEKPVAIRLAYTDMDMNADDYEKHMKWQGWFCLGYHYVLHTNGILETGIPLNQYADTSLPDWQNSIYVIVMSITINDAQKYTLEELSHKLNLPIEG